MKKLLFATAITLISFNNLAEEVVTSKKLKEQFISEVEDIMSERSSLELAWSADVKDEIYYLKKSENFISLEAELTAESYDPEFGDPVEEFEGKCKVNYKKEGKYWRPTFGHCDQDGFSN